MAKRQQVSTPSALSKGKGANLANLLGIGVNQLESVDRATLEGQCRTLAEIDRWSGANLLLDTFRVRWHELRVEPDLARARKLDRRWQLC